MSREDICALPRAIREQAIGLTIKHAEYERKNPPLVKKIGNKTWILCKKDSNVKYKKKEYLKIANKGVKPVIILDTNTRKEHEYQSIKDFADDIKAKYSNVYHYLSKYGKYQHYSLL